MANPFSAKYCNGIKQVSFNGSRVFSPIENILDPNVILTEEILKSRIQEIQSDNKYFHIHKISSQIFFATVEYFKSIQADWCNLPLTTLMISSPGEIYAGKTLDYTTDTLPVQLDWFNNDKKIFLSESSQFYLELHLLIKNIERVFCIYNSFRKEQTDTFHLSEFQHIEFEGKLSFAENTNVLLALLGHITNSIVKNCKENLLYFIDEKEIEDLVNSFDVNNVITITLSEVLKALHKDTKNNNYSEFSLKHFGAWEEIRATEIFNATLLITEYPVLQIPFYHGEFKTNEHGVMVAENGDLIGKGYREIAGSGVRVASIEALREKAVTFNLPMEDYEPYFKTRTFDYQKTSGFGIGIQRYIQWLLKIPFIWDASIIPRTHFLPNP